MGFWKKIREKVPIWGSRVAASLVILTVIFEIAHKAGLLDMLKIPHEAIMEGLLVCALTLGFFSIEEFSKTESTVELLKEKLTETDLMVGSLKETIVRSLDSTAQKVESLHEHQKSAIEIAGYTGAGEFDLHWAGMMETYESFAMWGKMGSDFTREFKTMQEKGKRCSYYLPIEEDSQDVASTFLLCAEEAKRDSLRLFESASFGNLSWLIGFDLPTETAEVLLCFTPLGDARFAGVYMTGDKAWRFYQCVVPRLEARSAPDQNSVPLRIYTQQQIETIVSSKVSFKQALADVDKGEILQGIESVCEGMSSQLRETRKFADVTHLCSAETIPLLRSPSFIAWLKVNYEVAAKKVVITRIFILPRALRSNQILREVIQEMRQNEINVLICDAEDLSNECLEDFSIYDERHVIYIDRSGGGPWVGKDDAMARRSDSWDRVNRYRTLFDIIKKRALQTKMTHY